MKRLLVTVLLVLALAGTAIAQEGTLAQTTILNRVNRQGTLMSASIVVPPAATGDLIIRALMTDAAIENPNYSFTLRIYYYNEADALWYQHGAMSWRGAPWVSNRPKVPPNIAIPLGDLAGKTVRVELDVPTQMSLGATAEVL